MGVSISTSLNIYVKINGKYCIQALGVETRLKYIQRIEGKGQ